MMQRLKFNVDKVEVEWGAGVDLNVLKAKLRADFSHEIKAVCVVHNETSTGVTNNIAAIRRVLGELTWPPLSPQDFASSLFVPGLTRIV